MKPDDRLEEKKEDNLTQPSASQAMSDYYAYGQLPENLNSLFGNQFADLEEVPKFAASGGLMSPTLMASGGQSRPGGLNIVHHSGKNRVDFRQGAAVSGPGDGQSDDIPAMLADGEFVFPADVVSALGNGSTKAGSDALYKMMHEIRRKARSTHPKELPPPAKSPLDYVNKLMKKRG